jgi:hypothetical protein
MESFLKFIGFIFLTNLQEVPLTSKFAFKYSQAQIAVVVTL